MNFIRGANYLNIFFNDLKILLKHVSHLSIQTVWKEVKYREYFVRFLVDVLKEEVPSQTTKQTKGNLHIESISLHTVSIDNVLLIIPLFNSQTLRSIELGGIHNRTSRKFERIFRLDQWKNAKYFTFWDTWSKCPPIEHFLHFEEFRFETQDFPIQNVIKIRDDLLQRCTFQECTISVLKSNFKPVEFARIFQQDYAGDDKFTIEYSNGNSKFKINCGEYHELMWEFEIERC